MNSLSVAPRVLVWDETAAALRAPVEQEYDILLHEALRHAAAETDAPADGELGLAGGAGLPTEAVRQVMRAPRTVRRVLWTRHGDRSRTLRYLQAALDAECAVRNPERRSGFTGWTADGRAFVRADATVRTQPTLDDRISLDLHSPHARSVDLVGGSRPVFPARPAPSAESCRQSVARVAEAWRGIRATPGAAADAVTAWTRVVVVQSDASEKFWSGSNGQYIGRVVLANVDAPGTPVEDVADALVHEAIHGFLYMHECVQPWVRGYSLYTDEGAIVSPWSGALLPVRPFMQACFVWYGLAMFWAQHVAGDVFTRDRVRFLLFRAVTGFRKGALADQLQPWRDEVDPEMVELIAELQRVILSLLD